MVDEEINKIFQEIDNNKFCTILFKDNNNLIADFKKVDNNKYNFCHYLRENCLKQVTKKYLINWLKLIPNYVVTIKYN